MGFCNLVVFGTLARTISMQSWSQGSYTTIATRKKNSEGEMVSIYYSERFPFKRGRDGRRRGWDVSREQHRNRYIIYGERSPAQVGCMKQVLGPGALGRPCVIGWRGRWEGGWGIHVTPRLIHVNE